MYTVVLTRTVEVEISVAVESLKELSATMGQLVETSWERPGKGVDVLFTVINDEVTVLDAHRSVMIWPAAHAALLDALHSPKGRKDL